LERQVVVAVITHPCYIIIPSFVVTLPVVTFAWLVVADAAEFPFALLVVPLLVAAAASSMAVVADTTSEVGASITAAAAFAPATLVRHNRAATAATSEFLFKVDFELNIVVRLHYKR